METSEATALKKNVLSAIKNMSQLSAYLNSFVKNSTLDDLKLAAKAWVNKQAKSGSPSAFQLVSKKTKAQNINEDIKEKHEENEER